MNNLEQMKKRRNRNSAIAVILIVLNLLLLLLFATNEEPSNPSNSNNIIDDGNGGDTAVINNVEDNKSADSTNANVAKVVTGADFTIALDDQGRVWSWGQNSKGQLGNGTTSASANKKAVVLKSGEQLSNVKQVAAGRYHAVALTNDGKVYVWGYNYNGQLLSETNKKILYPQMVNLPSETQVKQVAAGADYTLMLTTDGNVLGVGDSKNGQLGYYNDLSYTSLRDINDNKGETDSKVPAIRTLAAGYNHVVGIGNGSNNLVIWGGSTGTKYKFSNVTERTLTNSPIEIEAGNGVSMALDQAGKVYTWNVTDEPAQVSLPTAVRTTTEDNIAILNKTFFYIDSNNNVYAWGQSNSGQSGTGTNSSLVRTPKKLVIEDINIKETIDKITSSAVPGENTSSRSGYDTGYAINSDGFVLGWGYSGTSSSSNTYKLSTQVSRNKANYVGALSIKSDIEKNITLDITEAGKNDGKNKVNIRDFISEYVSGEVINLYSSEIQDIKYVTIDTSSTDETIAKYDETTGIIEGKNSGITTIIGSIASSKVTINIQVIGDEFTQPKIISRSNFTIALKADGTVWVWGKKDNLGIKSIFNGRASAIVKPTQIPGLTEIVDIAAGEDYILIVKSDGDNSSIKNGRVYAWGTNSNGVLGSGNISNRTIGSKQTIDNIYDITVKNEIGRVGSLENIKAISAGDDHAVALDVNGNVYSWGRNNYGQLGFGNTDGRQYTPKAMNLQNVTGEITQILAVGNNTYILTKDGTVYGCGINSKNNNQLGKTYDSNTLKNSTLEKIEGLPSGIKKISGAGSDNVAYVYALTNEGRAYAWGTYYGMPKQILTDVGAIKDIEATNYKKAGIFTTADSVQYFMYDSSKGITEKNKLYDDVDDNGEEQFMKGISVRFVAGSKKGSIFVVKNDGTVWVGGENGNNQLGNYAVKNKNKDTKLPTGGNAEKTKGNPLQCISYSYINVTGYTTTMKINESRALSNIKLEIGFNVLVIPEAIIPRFESSDTSIIEVDSKTGFLTAKGLGKAYVTVSNAFSEDKRRIAVTVLSDNATTLPKISVGSNHTLALKADGTVFGWGNSEYGELGVVQTNVAKPQKIDISEKVVDIVASKNFSVFLTESGKVLTIGKKNSSVLGRDLAKGESSSAKPDYVKLKDGSILQNIVEITALSNRVYALDANGNLYGWGYGLDKYAMEINTLGTRIAELTPRCVLTEDGHVYELVGKTLSIVTQLKNIVEISSAVTSATYTSECTMMALDADGTVYLWVLSSKDTFDSKVELNVPTKVNFPNGVEIVSITAGRNARYAISKTGDLYSWGYDKKIGILGLGNLGTTTAANTKSEPTLVEGISDVEEVYTLQILSANEKTRRTFVMKTDGSVYAFGANKASKTAKYSLLGNNDSDLSYYVPTEIGDSYLGLLVDGEPVSRISIGKNEHTINAKTVKNCEFNLKIPVAAEISSDVEVLDRDLITITPNTENNAEYQITANGKIGESIIIIRNKNSDEIGSVYVDIVEKTKGENAQNIKEKVTPKIESAGNHTIAIKMNGTVWGWGDNSKGQLGIAESYTKIPQQIELPANEKIVDVATCETHTLLLTTDGRVYSFGDNSLGQLGRLGSGIEISQVPELEKIVKVAVGNGYSLALDRYGKVYKFRRSEVTPYEISQRAVDITNKYILTADGEAIALNTNWEVSLRAKVTGIEGKIVKITNTTGHTAFLTKEGNVYTVGNGKEGQLGNNETTNKTTVVRVLDNEGRLLTNIDDIGVGGTHTIAVNKDGKVYTWGNNLRGQLGDSGTSNAVRAKAITDETMGKVIAVSAGNEHSTAINADGAVYAWGYAYNGQIGNNKTSFRNGESSSLDDFVRKPERVGQVGVQLSIDGEITNHVTLQKGGSDAKITASNPQFNVIKEDTTITADDLDEVTSSNIAIVTADKTSPIKISPQKAGTTSVVVKSKINSSTGEAVTNIIQVTVLPKEAELNISVPYSGIAKPMTVSGKNHTLILKSDGTVFAYGDNSYGQTGAVDKNGNKINYSDKENQIIFPEPIVQVAAGDTFSMALTKSGKVYAWGNNSNGQLGNEKKDKFNEVPTPIQVLQDIRIVKISANDNKAMALTNDGYVYVWGKNSDGALGTSSTADISKPKKLNDISNIIDIAVGTDHALLLDSSGKVYASGNNYKGQLGLGKQFRNSLAFREVSIVNENKLNVKIQAIAAGNATSMAIDTSGDLYAWGNNENNQLTLDGKTILTPEWALERTESVSLGDNHTLILCYDENYNRNLLSVGNNKYGQLGTNEEIGFFENIMSASAGNGYSTYITKEGYVYGFGNYYQDSKTGKNRETLTKSVIPVKITNEETYLDEKEITISLKEEYVINPNGINKLNVLYKDESKYTFTLDESLKTTDTNQPSHTYTIKGREVGTYVVSIKDDAGKINNLTVKVTDGLRAPVVDGGSEFTLITDNKGKLYGFGNKEGIAASSFPTLKNDSINIVDVKAGKDFIVAISGQDGSVWTMGDNSLGQLGIAGLEEDNNKLNRTDLDRVVQIDTGTNHVVALNVEGFMYVWGDNSLGQLGINNVTGDKSKVETPTVIKPINERIAYVSAGGNYTSFVDVKGNAYIMGNVDKSGDAYKIEGIDTLIDKVVTGTNQTLILDNAGAVYIITNPNKLIGNNIVTATKVTFNEEVTITDIAVSEEVFMCLTKDKNLYTFGSNKYGQLGLPKSNNYSLSNETINVPQLAVDTNNVFTMGAGKDNTYYIRTDGEVLAAGSNTSNGLGNGEYLVENSPVKNESRQYVKVGNATFELKPNATRITYDLENPDIWKVWFRGDKCGEELNTLIEQSKDEQSKVIKLSNEKGFNVFGRDIADASEYTFEIDDTTVVKQTEYSGEEDVYQVTAVAPTDPTITSRETTVKVTNKITGKSKTAKIVVVDPIYFRIIDTYITDTTEESNEKFQSQADGVADFLIDTEDCNYENGTLNVELEFNTDILTVVDAEANRLSVTTTNGSIYKISGLDLTKPYQEITIQLTDKENNVYTHKITIFKSTIVKVNGEALTQKIKGNEKTYTKFIKYTDTTANVEISIMNKEHSIELFDENNVSLGISTIDGNIAKLTKTVLTPDVRNKYIIHIKDEYGDVIKEYTLQIDKSSIDSIYAKDEYVQQTEVKADRISGTTYVEEYSVAITDKNNIADNPPQFTINLANKKVSKVFVNNVETEIKDNQVIISQLLSYDESEITNIIIRIQTTDGYEETHLLKVDTISSNTNIDLENTKLLKAPIITDVRSFRESPLGNNAIEVALHEPEAVFGEVEIKVATESAYAKLTLDNLTYCEENTFTQVPEDDGNGNRYVITAYVEAENGDKQEYKIYVFKESENAEIKEITTTGGARTEKATRENETNNYTGKVMKEQEGYSFTITCVDEYSEVKITRIEGIDENEILNYLVLDETQSHDGIFKYTILDEEIIGRKLTFEVQPEYDECSPTEYTLTLLEMSDDAQIGIIKVDDLVAEEIFPGSEDEELEEDEEDEENGEILDSETEESQEPQEPERYEAIMKATGDGKVTIVSRNEFAKVYLYANDPTINQNEEAIAEGTGTIETIIELEEYQTVTLYVKVVSEDERFEVVKPLIITKASNSIEILEISAIDGNTKILAEAVENKDYDYILTVSDEILEPSILVTTKSPTAIVSIGDGENGSIIDISGLDELVITVESEDGTNEKDYIVKIIKLVSDVSFEKKIVIIPEIEDEEDYEENDEEESEEILIYDYEFEVDENNEDVYRVNIDEISEPIKLVLEVANKDVMIRMAKSKIGETVIPEADREYVSNNVGIDKVVSLPIDSNATTQVAVEIVAPNGNRRNCTIVIKAAYTCIETMNIVSISQQREENDEGEIEIINSSIRELETKVISKEDIINRAMTVKIHPFATDAKINLEVKETVVPNVIVNQGVEFDETGSIEHILSEDEITIQGNKISFNVQLEEKLEKNIVILELTNNVGDTEILYIILEKGSMYSSLENVEITGYNSEDKETINYVNELSKHALTYIVNDNYVLKANCSEGGTAKIYKALNYVAIDEIDLLDTNSAIDVTNEPVTLKDNEEQRFIIEVTPEYTKEDGTYATIRYELYLRKAKNNNELNALKVTVDETIEKQLSDFGEFVYNETEGLYEVKVIVPKTINTLKVSDLSFGDGSSATWSTITSKYAEIEYDEYRNDARIMEGIALDDLQRVLDTEGYLYIKVKAENGNIATYRLTIVKAENIKDKEFEVFDIVKESEIPVNKSLILNSFNVEILDNIAQIKAILQNTNGQVDNISPDDVVTMGISQINGENVTINSVVSNELDINMGTITYTDDENNVKTIEMADIKSITVNAIAKTKAAVLYPEYYTNEKEKDYLQEYKLYVTRIITDSKLYINIENIGTITDTDFDEGVKNGNTTVRTYTISVPVDTEEIKINSIKANNKHIKIQHAQTPESNELYTENPYVRMFIANNDIVEDIIVKLDNGEEVIYKLIVKKYDIKLNNNTISKDTAEVGSTDIIVLKPIKEFDLLINNISENNNVSINVVSINGANITPIKINERRISKDTIENNIYASLPDSYKVNLENIVIKVEITPKDTTKVDTYTININCETSNIVSIDGLDTNGNVGDEFKLNYTDFKAISSNKYETDVIVIPYKVNEVTLSNIVTPDEKISTITDNDNNALVDGKLTFSVGKNGVTDAVIKVTISGVTQEFTIHVRRANIDTGIKEICTEYSRTTQADESGEYTINVKDLEDPILEIIPEDENASVTKAYLKDSTLETVKVEEPDNAYKIVGMKTDVHDATEQELTIVMVVEITAENGNTLEYTINVVRKHTENGIQSVSYKYGTHEDITVYSESGELATQKIPSTEAGIYFTDAIAVCSKAKVFVDGESIDPTKLYGIEKGTTREFTITVIPEFGNIKEYKLGIRRKSDNTDIEKILANTDIEATIEGNIYVANIKVTDNLAVKVTPKDELATVTEIVEVFVGAQDFISNVSDIEDNSFTIDNLANLYNNDETEDTSNDSNRFVFINFKVTAEDEEISRLYTLKVTRQHIETAINDISYSYTKAVVDENGKAVTDDEGKIQTEPGSNTIKVETEAEILLSSVSEKVHFDKITAQCIKAKEIKIEVDDISDNNQVQLNTNSEDPIQHNKGNGFITQEQDENGFDLELPEENVGDGCIRTIKITATAESGDIQVYTIEVIRLATNATLGKIYVNGDMVTKVRETEEGIEKTYEAYVKDSDKQATISAISAMHVGATVSIKDDNDNCFAKDASSQSYKLTGTYDLSSATEREESILIEVNPEDPEIPSKVYKLVLVRLYDSTDLISAEISAMVDEMKQTQEIHSTDFNEDSTQTYYTTDTIVLDTNWSVIKLENIVPGELDKAESIITVQVEGEEPTTYTEGTDYNVQDTEGKLVCFSIRIKAESGSISEKPYNILVYKKATNTELDKVVVNEKEASLVNNVYKVNIDANAENIVLDIAGNNKLSKDKTTIKSITINDKDYTNSFGITNGAKDNVVTFTLRGIDGLDYVTDRIITFVVEVTPEDETIDSVEYTVEVTRQHTSTVISSIELNNNTEYAQTVSNLTFNMVKNRLEKEIKVTSQLSETTINAINLECASATMKLYVDANKDGIYADSEEVTLPLSEEGLKLSLPEEGDTQTLKVIITPEYEYGQTVEEYIIVKRSHSDAKLQLVEVTEKAGQKDEEKPVITIDGNTYTADIHKNSDDIHEKTALKIVATDEFASVLLSLDSILNKDGFEIKIGDEIQDLTYENKLSSLSTNIITGQGRKFILTALVQPEDMLLEPEKYTIELTRLDNSADILKVLGLETTGTKVIDPSKEDKYYKEKYGNSEIDDSIYVYYIDENADSVTMTITPESKFAKVYLNGSTENSNENGIVRIYEELEENEISKEISVRIVSEDGRATRNYTIYCIKKSDDTSVKQVTVTYIYDGLTYIEQVTKQPETQRYLYTLREINTVEGLEYDKQVKEELIDKLEIKLPDTVKDITVNVLPSYEYAMVEIQTQGLEWKQTTKEIKDIPELLYDMETGEVKVPLHVQISESQTMIGENIWAEEILLIDRISTRNTIKTITTDEEKDNISKVPGRGTHGGVEEEESTYTINLNGYGREEITLKIEPTSPMAKLTLYRYEEDKVNGKWVEKYTPIEGAEAIGVLVVPNITVDEEEIITYVVKVELEIGIEAKYFIDTVPKDSQAELIEATIDGNDIELEPCRYDYIVENLIEHDSGDVYAKAADPESNVEIYTLNKKVEHMEEATLKEIDFKDTKCVSVVVTSPNKKYSKTYQFFLEEVEDLRELEQLTYTTNLSSEETIVPIEGVTEDEEKDGYKGRYVIEVLPEVEDININMIATSDLAIVTVKENDELTEIQRYELNITRDIRAIDKDLELDIIVTAQSENMSKYKLVIKKQTILTGNLITENTNEQVKHSGVEVKILQGEDLPLLDEEGNPILESKEVQVLDGEGNPILDEEGNPITTTEEVQKLGGKGTPILDEEGERIISKTDKDGLYIAELPEGTYQVLVEKDGYITYKVEDINLRYGRRTYIGTAKLIAGEIYNNDDYIDARDLAQLNKVTRLNGGNGIATEESDTSWYDFNGDGRIDEKDLKILMRNYNKGAKANEYTRQINITGEVLDQYNKVVPNAIVEIGGRVQANEEGKFTMNNIPVKDYTLVVKDANKKIIGQSDISILEDYVEDSVYEISNNIITVNQNVITIDVTIRINGDRAVISEAGTEAAEDIILPVGDISAEFTENGIAVTVNASDTNLSKIEFYYGDEETLFATETIDEGNSSTLTKEYKIATKFNTTYKFHATVTDKAGNYIIVETEITDNTIKSEDDLIEFSNAVNSGKTYKDETVILAKDLNLTNKEFNPIGDRTHKFEGTFEGNGHTISNMNITEENRVGLFGNVDGATIKNVGIKDSVIETNGTYVGAIVGLVSNSEDSITTIENCYNSATIISTSNSIGGIVGGIDDNNGQIIIRNCYNSGDIKGTTEVGGIIGKASVNTTIENCYNIGTISANENVESYGDIVGYEITETNENGETIGTTVTNCYSKADVTLEKLAYTDEEEENINNAFAEDIYNLNNGYPVLKWQNENYVETETEPIVILPFDENTEYSVTYDFGPRTHPQSGDEDVMHYGIDLAIASGTPVLAIADGTITYIDRDGTTGYGYCIEIKHEIDGEIVYSFYAHLSEIDEELIVGKTVTKGQQIALSGGGENDPGAGTSTGPHLHLEIRTISQDYSSAVDPRDYLTFKESI